MSVVCTRGISPVTCWKVAWLCGIQLASGVKGQLEKLHGIRVLLHFYTPKIEP